MEPNDHIIRFINFNNLCKKCIILGYYDEFIKKGNVLKNILGLNSEDCLRYFQDIHSVKFNEKFENSKIDNVENISSNKIIIKCQGCNKSFLEDKIQIHYKKCKNALSECKYCHLNISNSECKEHEYICGSRTDACLDCNDIVKIREIDVHLKFLCKKRKKNKI